MCTMLIKHHAVKNTKVKSCSCENMEDCLTAAVGFAALVLDLEHQLYPEHL